MKSRVCRLYGQNDIRIETDEVRPLEAGEVLVRIGAGGICGSDLHYYQDGGFGQIRVREPIILGHEISGTVEALADGVSHLAVGDRVALNPARPCGTCRFCLEGASIHCLNMRFYGSALRFPHEQGAFRDLMITTEAQCFKIEDHVSLAEAACAEPLAVCLHARNRAPALKGKRVLVTGAGPIGALTVALASEAGAAEVVVTDLQDATLDVAARMGATRTVNVGRDPQAMTAYEADKGYFDVTFECSAAAPAIRTAIATTRPMGTIIQVGVTGEQPVPINLLVGKEIALIGTHRFDQEYGQAVAALNARKIDVKPIITGSFPLDEAKAAFAEAADRTKAVKVQLAFA